MQKQLIGILALVLILFLFSSCNKNDCDPASTANAGPDQSLEGIATTNLAATEPTGGTGVWSIVSGDGGVIKDLNSPTSEFSGVLGKVYVLKWTVSGCPLSEDEVSIELVNCQPASAANAGPDQDVPGTTTKLAATAPTSGTGTWSIVSGDGGSISAVNSPTSDFSGQVGKTYILKWLVSGCPTSEDQVQIKFNSNPALLTVNKTSVINGSLITVTGVNFSSNYQGMSQIKAVSVANPANEVFLPIVSRTETQIVAVMMGTGGGSLGDYKLYYGKRPDANPATFYASNLTVSVVSASVNFFTSPTYTNTNIEVTNANSNIVAFGVKNGSANAGDYTVKLVQYNYETGVSTESTVPNFNFTVGGYGGTMDQIDFTFPNNLPKPGTYYVKVTYGSTTLIGGWGYTLNVY